MKHINIAARYAQNYHRQRVLASLGKEDFKFKQSRKKTKMTKKEVENDLIARLIEQVEALEKKEVT